MISHYLICQRCGESNPVEFSEEDNEDSLPSECDSCGSTDLIVED